MTDYVTNLTRASKIIKLKTSMTLHKPDTPDKTILQGHLARHPQPLLASRKAGPPTRCDHPEIQHDT